MGFPVGTPNPLARLLKAGLAPQDVVVGVGGQSAANEKEAARLLREFAHRAADAGDEPLSLDVKRGEFLRLHIEYAAM